MGLGTAATVAVGVFTAIQNKRQQSKAQREAARISEAQANLQREFAEKQFAAQQQAAAAQAAAIDRASQLQYKAALESAEIQSAAIDRATQVQWNMYNQTRKDQLPWLKAGQEALGTLRTMVAEGPGEYKESDDYQFLLDRGEEGINRLAASRGQYFSGGTYKELTEFNKNLASMDYDKFLTRYYKSLEPYQQLAGAGQQTANVLGAEGQQTANAVSDLTVQGGQAEAEGRMASANALAAGYIGKANALANNGSGQYNQAMMDAALTDIANQTSLRNSRLQSKQQLWNNIGTITPYIVNGIGAWGTSGNRAKYSDSASLWSNFGTNVFTKQQPSAVYAAGSNALWNDYTSGADLYSSGAWGGSGGGFLDGKNYNLGIEF